MPIGGVSRIDPALDRQLSRASCHTTVEHSSPTVGGSVGMRSDATTSPVDGSISSASVFVPPTSMPIASRASTRGHPFSQAGATPISAVDVADVKLRYWCVVPNGR